MIDISPWPLNQLSNLLSMLHSRNPFPKPAFYPQLKPPNWPAKKLPSLQDLRRLRVFPTNSTDHRSNWKYLDLSNSCLNFSFSFTMFSVTDSTTDLAVSVLILPSQKGLWLSLKCPFESSTVFVKTWFSESSRESLVQLGYYFQGEIKLASIYQISIKGRRCIKEMDRAI